MPAADKISALRGMRDVFSKEYARHQAIRGCLERHLRLHSYAAIDLPLLEDTELYLRKSGEDIAARLYEFDFKSRRVALRPEFTASILRAYVERLQDEPLPLRIQYSGPVFRYEKPQQHRYRQFSLTGAELIGAAGPRADAEALHLACSGLQQLGLRDYTLTIGHTALLERFLNKLGLRKQLVNFLLRNMENLRKRGVDSVLESLALIYPEFGGAAAAPTDKSASAEDRSQRLINVLREMTEGEAHQAVTDFLHSLNIRIAANRDEGEVIERLLRKIREDQQAPKVQLALDFMRRLGDSVGAPADVLSEARALAEEFDLESDILALLERTLDCLAEYGGLKGAIQLDFGMNRGLHYYTGLIFELHAATSAGEMIQLCGGGRYDNLISVLGGGESTPALGFAYGIERIHSVLPGGAGTSIERPAVYVIPVAEADFAAGVAAAEDLRAHDIVVEVSIDGRSLRRSLRHADRRGAAHVIIIGEDERRRDAVILRDMRSGKETQLPRSNLAKTIVERWSAND
ncbi:MAG: HisS family protein [Chloroflexi bacterium]|nr:HisS family protein [Chloroflexota bacterium]